ncbi:hypothetical protein VD659_00930 [Herbiconiux sp. 11R-BC]|uniref:hypothetical protein n=1 Tax=Herbiconiux sp. 11R-BC TaxID=3111637 RepID=UPI003C006FA3
MSDSRDRDALGWAGDDDPTLDPVGVPGDDELDAVDEVDETDARGAASATRTAPGAPATPATATSARAEPAPPAATRHSGPDARAAAVATTAAAPRPTVLDEAEEADDRAAEKELEEAEAAAAQMSSVALISLGILGGIYLLYTIGWIISFARYSVPITVDFTVVSARIAQSLAVAAAPLWFVATLLLTQKRHAAYRFLWLVVGVLVLVPWPFLRGF